MEDYDMAKKNQLLLDNLFALRDGLRERFEDTLICTDDAIEQMAKKKPLRLSDFLAIPGLDNDFYEVYAHLFLSMIESSTSQSIHKVEVSRDASIVLDRYKDRLTNISKTNPNLYMGYIAKNKSFDLYDASMIDQLKDFISYKKDHFKINMDDGTYAHLRQLYRQINKDYKDLGLYHVYIAYPFVEGIFAKEGFPIKAPLAYMPVILDRNKKTFSLSIDKEKDIILNRDLILTLSKMEKTKIDTTMPDIEDLSKKTIKEIILPFYQKHGLNASYDDQSLFEAFDNQRKDVFIKNKKKGFKIRTFICFGRYHLYSSTIQKDMAEIIESNTYNDLLEGLIDEKHLYDKEKQLDIDVSNDLVNEYGLVYINDVNYAQEKVLEMLDQERKIVIWGPPGTGKSQTITSLIANQVLKDENVLIVSEKKVALDVIAHRLGQAKHFTLFLDDASNKQSFYKQINDLLNAQKPIRRHNNDLYKLNNDIKKLDRAFNQAMTLVYQTEFDGYSLANIYNRYLKDRQIIETLTPKKVFRTFNKYLSNPSFSHIENLEETFDKDKKLYEFITYHKYHHKYPWFIDLNTVITRSSAIEFKTVIDAISANHTTIEKKWFFKRRKLKKALFKRLHDALPYLSRKKRIQRKIIQALYEDQEFRIYMETYLRKLDKIKFNYLKLNDLATKFLDMVLFDHNFDDLEPIEKYRSYIFDAYMTGFIEDFKTNHQKYLYIFDDYEKHMKNLNDLIHEKQAVAKESFEMRLFEHSLDFSNTKRIMDIRRVIESPKKPSVKAFMDLFGIELMSHVKVWLCTPEALSASLPLSFNMFDLVVFDEASQMYVEKGIPAIYRAKKVAIAGDPKQLRPSSLGMGRLDEDDPFEEDEILKNVTFDAKSLLDLARYKYKEALLNYHYRSKYQELIEFSNQAFYQGKLIISPNVIQPKKPPIEYIYVKDGVFENRDNQKEAEAVIKLLKKVLKDKEDHMSIGIITFNSSQRDLILNMMDELLFKRSVHQKRLEKELYRTVDGGDQSIFVKNIENVQGDERDIIIFSMGYGQDPSGVVKRRFGWLNHDGGQNRLNVAITRAKEKIYFVSSLMPEALKVDDLSGQGPKLLKDYMRYSYYVSQSNNQMAEEVLKYIHQSESQSQTMLMSHMTENIKIKLEKAGYMVDVGIGIGQFKIDLAIRNPKTMAYDLGIICDLSDPVNTNARKELLHQEKFLMARGWQIKRVFHMHWYEDERKIIRDIKKLIN
jgi:superfamily I DNA and/or RNA helicase